VRENVASDIEQMDGVVDNIDHIWECYRMMMHIWPLDSHIARYNYEDGDLGANGYTGILAAAMHHKYSWRGVEYVH
jgi:hypothetical protein